MPQVSVFSLRFSKLSIFFTYLSVNHTRDDLSERADPRVNRKEVLSQKKVYLNSMEKRKPWICWSRKNVPHFLGLQFLDKLCLLGIAGGTRRTG